MGTILFVFLFKGRPETMIAAPLNISNSRYNFVDDEFYILLSYPSAKQDTAKTCITPSLTSILNAKRNGISSSLETISVISSDEDEDYDVSSFESSRHSSIIDHPLSEEEEEEEEEYCYCCNDTKKIKKQPSILELAKLSFKKLSNLAISLSQQQASLTMSFNARMTDDKFMSLEEEEMTELVTFIREEPELKRHRESRINSKFLRIYSHDYSLKCLDIIPQTDEELDYCLQHFSDLSPSRRQFIKLACLSRDKLWSNVVLPPRQDEILQPTNVIKVDNKIRYQYTKKNHINKRWA